MQKNHLKSQVKKHALKKMLTMRLKDAKNCES